MLLLWDPESISQLPAHLSDYQRLFNSNRGRANIFFYNLDLNLKVKNNIPFARPLRIRKKFKLK